ncbi:MAG: ABC transporter permease [Roseburia sp.]|nr:ABC transporter permease [Roseburia sp.]MCM1201671.1 ABC transporter permease [Bacteroides fragilis]
MVKAKNRFLRWFENLILIICIVFVWGIVTETGAVNSILLPSPKVIGITFFKKIADKSLLIAIGVSVGRVVKGYLYAVTAGICMGVFIGLSEYMYRMTKVIIQLLKPIPPIAWIPLVILWMGIGENSKVFLIFLGGFFVVLINVIDGIRYIDPKLTEVATAVETPRMKYIFQLVIPAAMPGIFTGLRVALGTSWSCVVAAELVAASSGVGYMISNARNFGQMDVVIIGMISIGIVGKIMDEILKIIERRVLAWNT